MPAFVIVVEPSNLKGADVAVAAYLLFVEKLLTVSVVYRLAAAMSLAFVVPSAEKSNEVRFTSPLSPSTVTSTFSICSFCEPFISLSELTAVERILLTAKGCGTYDDTSISQPSPVFSGSNLTVNFPSAAADTIGLGSLSSLSE